MGMVFRSLLRLVFMSVFFSMVLAGGSSQQANCRQ